MFYHNEDEEVYNEIDLSDSQFNEYIRKIDEENVNEGSDPQFES